ncbi:MAG: putative glycoside hydrolase [Candidatus Eisenbacteria bacterium]
MKRRLCIITMASVCATLLSGTLSVSGAAQGYPRLGLYGSIMGDGYPYVLANGSLDTTAIAQVARYDEVILDVNPITPYRPDVLAALRARNPDIRLLAYVLGHDIWNAADPDSLNHYPTRYRRLVRDAGGFLYNSVTNNYYPGVSVNLAKRDLSGRFVVAEGLADLIHEVAIQSGVWDGVFFDVFCHSITWSQDATRKIDFARAGYASIATFDAAWQAATDTLANRIRRLSGGSPIIVGNCAGSAHTQTFNGWMRENFPYQGGGTWYQNMLTDPQGYFADERDFAQPAHNYIFSAMQGASGNQYSAENTAKVRFGLASAALGEGYGVFGPSDRVATTAPYHSYWYDEYAVDLANGRASNSIAHTGWLGQPLGPQYQMIWAGTNPDAVSNPDFETSATTGWSFSAFAPAAATIARDLTSAPVGTSSARISVTASSSVSWYVNLTTLNSIAVYPWLQYSVTFWARASAPRTFEVVASNPGGGSVASRNVTVDTQWRHYQVVLQPNASVSSKLVFYLGAQVGDIWFDDIHFQQGATSLYRRDFQNGTVLVNPSDQLLQVPLGGTFQRILGLVAPGINDGATVTSVSVNPNDALFLLSPNTDIIPPAAVNDMRPGP